MKKKVLVTYKMPYEGYLELVKHCDVTFSEGQTFTYEEVYEVIDQYDALLSMYDFKVDKALIDKATKLKIVSNYAVGFDNVDISYCTEKGIQVTNTPDVVTDPTADQALGLMLAVARNIVSCARKFRSPEGFEWGLLNNLGVSLYGKTLGIIGMGRIGLALAKRAIACGMKIVYNNRKQLSQEQEQEYNATYVSFDDLLRTSDFISVNAPHTPETHHMLDTPQFEMMKPDAIVINTARGPLIHEQALIDALKNNTIRGAGLDVYEFGEVASPGLLTLENVVLNPHTGTQTIDVRNEMSRVASRNILSFFDGEGTIHRVNNISENK